MHSEFISLHADKNATLIQGGPKKESHYQESSLNRIKNRQCVHISHQFWVQNEHKDVIGLC